MASVSSLDKDLRKLRLEKYTPAAADEVRAWIEGVLGSPLPSANLLDGLKDGVALCKLVNLAIEPKAPLKFKQSSMPFVQMENISHFLRACKSPPLNLQEHDMFLTVDLYEQKDPAQVLQCIGAFSRAAHTLKPSVFPTHLGPKGRGGLLTPQETGHATSGNRGASHTNTSTTTPPYGSRSTLSASRTGDTGSGRPSPGRSPTNDKFGSAVSTWSKKESEGITNPAWNIAQYGYMGGASQGNLGIAFGGRRQIIGTGPRVPTLADKERERKAGEAQAARQKLQMEEEEHRRKADLESEEKQAQVDEERKWEEETRRLRAEEKRKTEEEKRKWAEEERQWRLTEEKRRREEEEAEAKLAEERVQARNRSEGRPRGQTLTQYQAEETTAAQSPGETDYSSRIKQLEQELALARQREQEYEEERQKRSPGRNRSKSRTRSRSRPNKAERPPSRQDSWRPRDEKDYLRAHPHKYQAGQQELTTPLLSPRPLPDPTIAAVKTHRTGERTSPGLLVPQRTGESRPLPVPGQVSPGHVPSPSSRPLPVPQAANRVDRHLASNPAPVEEAPRPTYSRELDVTAERDDEDHRRAQSQVKTKAGEWASKSLLEREMEMERQRQREWEEAQEETSKATPTGEGVDGIGGGIGGRWDVSQWAGFTGGDSQNKGTAGIGAGRRPIVGPRPLPNRP
ncbi:hypothetical protein GGR50DRAFT_148725 [Xylaria sp. CBS 124048]|nr:hypothetical protein GGR50DRAFT_148725 [Xylaria sp. CBS 124048]